MIWAYEELGWGGYWGWDPVENAGLLPWFTATAFLHSVMVQERRGMLRVWNVSLVIITFFLTIFGTFMTRSGVVQSVHAFGEDIALARLFTVFMVAIIVVSFGFVIYRLPLLRARNELDSWLSREAAFLVNNWILLFAALFVLFATMFPTLSEAVTGERLTVGPPFFNKWMLPIGLIAAVPDRHRSAARVAQVDADQSARSFLIPVACALVVGVAVVALGVRVWASGICFAFSAFVIGTISAGVLARRARPPGRHRHRHLDGAAIGLVARNKRRYGGYIIHVGIVLIFLGFAGKGFKQGRRGVSLKPGQQVQVGDFIVRLDAVKVTDDGQKQMITADTTVLRDGKEIARDVSGALVLPQARGAADDGGGDPPRLRRRPLPRDAGVRASRSRRRAWRITSTRWSNWVWVGFGVLAHRHRHRAAAGSGLHVRAREPAGRRRDGVDAAARAGAVPVGARWRSETVPVTQQSALAATARRRDHLHVRLP